MNSASLAASKVEADQGSGCQKLSVFQHDASIHFSPTTQRGGRGQEAWHTMSLLRSLWNELCLNSDMPVSEKAEGERVPVERPACENALKECMESENPAGSRRTCIGKFLLWHLPRLSRLSP